MNNLFVDFDFFYKYDCEYVEVYLKKYQDGFVWKFFYWCDV